MERQHSKAYLTLFNAFYSILFVSHFNSHGFMLPFFMNNFPTEHGRTFHDSKFLITSFLYSKNNELIIRKMIAFSVSDTLMISFIS